MRSQMSSSPSIAPRIRRSAVPALALALLAGAGPAAAQESTFEEVTDVVEVQVPINVVTRDGNPVRGLTAEDFEIFDRGRKQEITDFQVVDLDALPAEALPGPGAFDAAIPAAARRHFLLLFDLTFSSPASVTKARRAASQFVLANLHPSDLVAVATFSLDLGPRLLVTFTPDRAQLARAIDTLGAPRLLERQGLVDPLQFMIEDPTRAATASHFDESETGSKGRFAGLDGEVQAYLQVIANEMNRQEKSYRRGLVSSWVGALEDMAGALKSVDGRKHVVFFSEGFDGRLMLGRGADAWDESAQNDRTNLQFGRHWMVDTDDIYGNTALQAQAHDMLEAFRRSDCVIQAVDISGLGSESAEDRRARTVGQDALFYMANETGGTLFENTNDLASELDDVLARSSVSYVISFRPSNLEQDGSYHRLEVKVRPDLGRGTAVSHRAGYFAPRPYGELHPLEKNLIAADAIAAGAPRRELDLDVLAAPFRATDERSYVPVIIEVDGKKLLAGQDPGKPLATEFYTYVSDDQGQMRDFFTHRVTLNLTEEGRATMRESGLKYYGHLSLEEGNYLVRVLVRNADTGRTGVQTVRVSVPDFSEDEPKLLPPFFLEPSGRWFLVREERSTSQDTVVYPFTVNGSPYIPAAKPVIEPGEESDLVLVAYNLPDGEVEVSGTVITSDGRQIDVGGLAVVERTITGIGGLDKLRARLRLTDLERGTYTLEVALKHSGAGLAQVNSIPFSVPN